MTETTIGPGAPFLLRLREVGLRPTAARVGILQVLDACRPRRIDADTVLRDLQVQGMYSSLATVYRVLKDLVDHDLLLQEWRDGLNGGKAVYGILPPEKTKTRPGLRIVCECCGCATQIADPSLQDRLCQSALRGGLRLAERPLSILGTCAQCAPDPQDASDPQDFHFNSRKEICS